MTTNRNLQISFGALFLFVAVSVILNLILYERLRHFYSGMYAVRLDPLGLSYFQDSVDRKAESEEKPIIAFFGDSRAAQWPNPLMDGYQIVNRGIGNQTSAQVAHRFDDHIQPLQPDIVLIQVGINDLKTIPLFPRKKEEIISNCEENIQTIIQSSLGAGSSVIVTTIFPTGKIPLFRRLVWSEEIDQAIEEVNEYIRQLGQDRVVIIDTAKILSDTDGHIKPEYSFDTLHLNEQGYETLNQELIAILKSLE